MELEALKFMLWGVISVGILLLMIPPSRPPEPCKRHDWELVPETDSTGETIWVTRCSKCKQIPKVW